MTVRRTAYRSLSWEVGDGEAVTVDVYLLWPPGYEGEADALLASATAAVRAELGGVRLVPTYTPHEERTCG